METLTIKRADVAAILDVLGASSKGFAQKAEQERAKGDTSSLLCGEYHRGCAGAFDAAVKVLAGYLKEWEKEQED